jgi:signal transduction histidine kinase
VRAVEQWLEMSVTDGGKGMPANNVQTVFFAERAKAHALTVSYSEALTITPR